MPLPEVTREIERRMSLLGSNPQRLSKAAGLSKTYVRDLLEGRVRSPRADSLRKIAKALGCTPGDLMVAADLGGDDLAASDAEEVAGARATSDHLAAYNGTLQPSIIEVGKSDFASIGRYDASFSAGPGSLLDPHAEPLDYQLVTVSWLRSLTNAAPELLAIVRVKGDSMMQTLWDGDWVLVDRSQRRVSLEGIYALRVHDDSWIKRISLNLREKLVRIISDNPVFPIQELPEEDVDLIGRVISLVSRRLP